MHPDLTRVVTIGTSCAGKTDFSMRLSQVLGVPHIELDALFWLPNWQQRGKPAFRQLVGAAVDRDRWVVDGNYGSVRDLVWPRATAIVWLNYPFAAVMWRGIRRTVGRTLWAEELFGGNRESLRRTLFSRESILLWVVTTYHRRRREYWRLFACGDYANLHVIEFRNGRDADEFLRRVIGA